MSLSIDKTVAFPCALTLFIGNLLHIKRENSLQIACSEKIVPLSLQKAFLVTSKKVGGVCIINSMDALFADRILQKFKCLNSAWKKECIRVLLGSTLVRLTSSWTFREAFLYLAFYRIVCAFCKAMEQTPASV